MEILPPRHSRKPVALQLDFLNLLDSRAVTMTVTTRLLARRYRMSPTWAALVAEHAGIGGGAN